MGIGFIGILKMLNFRYFGVGAHVRDRESRLATEPCAWR